MPILDDKSARVGAAVFRTDDYWEQGFPTHSDDTDILLEYGLIKRLIRSEEDGPEDVPDMVSIGDEYFQWTEEGLRVREHITKETV